MERNSNLSPVKGGARQCRGRNPTKPELCFLTLHLISWPDSHLRVGLYFCLSIYYVLVNSRVSNVVDWLRNCFASALWTAAPRAAKNARCRRGISSNAEGRSTR